MKLLKNLVFLFFFILCFTQKSKAQKLVTHQQQIWFSADVNYNLNKKWSLNQSNTFRYFYSPWRRQYFLTAIQANYKLNNSWTVGGEVTFLTLSSPSDPHITNTIQLNEWRPDISITNKQIISKKFFLTQRLMSEFKINQATPHKYSYQTTTFRYRILLNYMPTTKLLFKAGTDLCLNIGEQIVYNLFDHNRATATMQYKISKYFSAEVGYMNWFQQQSSGNKFYDRDIITTALHFNIN